MSSVVKLIAEKWYKLLEVPREFDESFVQLLKNEGGFTEMKFEDFDREANKDKYARNVIWALYFCEEVSKKYKEKGIPEEIMLDTLFDIKNRIIRSTGELGYFCLKGLDTWFWLHLSFKLFKVGCLQYQLRGAEGGAEHLGVSEGENVLAIHIPKGTSIKKRDVLASFDAANRFFEKYFPEYEYKFFTCHSWLIDKTLNKFLEPDSNIITFQNLFTYACQTPLDSAITFCFPFGVTRENIKDFTPKTSLQEKIRDHVLNGGALYYSFGVRPKYKDIKVPIALNIDDFTPCVHLYSRHHETTLDGRKLVPSVPYDFLCEFIELIKEYGVKGKLSVVPLPAGENPFNTEEGKKWCTTVHENLDGLFSYCPEMLTHEKAYDLKTDTFLDINELEWSKDKGENEYYEYIKYALSLLKERGFSSSGTTSPWNFGENHLKEYESAISRAVKDVYGKSDAWYFLFQDKKAKAKTVLENDGCRLVSISSTSPDAFWKTINTKESDEALVNSIADELISADGKDGSIIYTLKSGGHPVILTHWQSLFSNGLKTGLQALRVVLERIKTHLSDRVEFKSYEEIMELALNEKA